MSRITLPAALGRMAAVAGLCLAPLWAAADSGDSCRELSDADRASLTDRPAVVVDIDGVLTQYVLFDYGPTNGIFLDTGVAYPRADAALLMNIYHRRGYAIVYMAGRPRQLEVAGQSMCQATLDWLQGHGFPTESADTLLLLRDGAASVVDADDRGSAMAQWMGDNGTDLFVSFVDGARAELGIDPRYGYVDSDVIADAFLDVGVPAGHIFTIGNKGVSRLGYRGTVPIFGPELQTSYTRHVTDFVVPDVPAVE